MVTKARAGPDQSQELSTLCESPTWVAWVQAGVQESYGMPVLQAASFPVTPKY